MPGWMPTLAHLPPVLPAPHGKRREEPASHPNTHTSSFLPMAARYHSLMTGGGGWEALSRMSSLPVLD